MIEIWIAISIWLAALLILRAIYRVEDKIDNRKRNIPDKLFDPFRHGGKDKSSKESENR